MRDAFVLATIGNFIGPLDYAAILRIVLAAFLGATIGWERERHGRAAGLRTHLLLCVGCALVMLTSLYVPARYAGISSDNVLRVDPSRLAGNVVTGIGFLGAGAIIVLGRHIRGLTTAACIWVTAAIGLAVGAGYIVPAIATHLVVLFSLVVLAHWEKRMGRKDRYIQLLLGFSQPGTRAESLRRLLASHSLDTLQCTVDREGEQAAYRMQLRYSRAVDFEQVSAELQQGFAPDGLQTIEWR